MSDHEATGAPISITLRMPPPVAAALAALETATGGVIPRHRLALEALRRGALLLAATPGALFAVDLAAAPPPAAPAAPTVAPAQPSLPLPSPRPSSPPAKPRPDVVAAPLGGDGGNPGRRLAADELAALRASVVAAVQRGASASGLARAAGHDNSGAVRRTITALRDGAEVAVTARLAAELSPAAEGWGR